MTGWREGACAGLQCGQEQRTACNCVRGEDTWDYGLGKEEGIALGQPRVASHLSSRGSPARVPSKGTGASQAADSAQTGSRPPPRTLLLAPPVAGQVHTSTGIMPSLLLRGGKRDSSARNSRGNCTRCPSTLRSCSRATIGLTEAKFSTPT